MSSSVLCSEKCTVQNTRQKDVAPGANTHCKKDSGLCHSKLLVSPTVSVKNANLLRVSAQPAMMAIGNHLPGYLKPTLATSPIESQSRQ